VGRCQSVLDRDWLLHLTYRQRDADRWLAANLPANSVLIGAVTPGLTLNNRFVCVNVIENSVTTSSRSKSLHRPPVMC